MKYIISNFVKKCLGLLNIHPDHNQRWILASSAISGLISTYIGPRIMKTLIFALPAEWIAFQNLSFAVAGLIVGVLWRSKIRSTVIKYFAGLAALESLCGFFLGLYLAFVEWNVMVFAVASLVYGSLIVTFVSKAIMAFKTVLWSDRGREIYDNNQQTVAGIVCVVGFAVALLAMPSLKVALVLWSTSCIIDDLGWILIYIRNRKILKNI